MEEGQNDAKGRLKILLVDDEPEFLQIIKKRMSKRNIDVTTATSGSEAIATLHGKNFDCAVVDLRMQDMNGIEVLKIFKKMVPEMPVIMLTGHGSERAAREGLAEGAFDYLTKPCDLQNLIKKISAAVLASK